MTVKLTRALRADDFGVIVFATSVLAYAALVVEFGFAHLGPIEVARRRIPLGRLVTSVVAIRSALTVAGFAALLIFTSSSAVSDVQRTVILIYGVSLIADALSLEWVFLGSEMMDVAAISEILSQGILTLGILTMVNTPAQIMLVPYLYLAGRLVSLIYLGLVYWRRFRFPGRLLDRQGLKTLMRHALPLTGTTAVAMITHNFDLVLLGLWLGAAATGVYGAAYRIVWVPTVITTAYFTALRPSLAKAHTEGVATVASLLQSSARLTTAFGVATAAGGAFLAKPIVVFLFGSAYAPAAGPLRWLLVAFAFMAVSRNYRLTLICFRRQDIDLQIMTLAAVTNIVLNVILVPRMGINGAAIAALSSEALILVGAYLATSKLLIHVPFGRFVIRPALCAAAMILLMIAAGSLPILLRIFLGAAAFATLAVATSVIQTRELRILLRGWLTGPAADIEPASPGGGVLP